MVTGSSYAFYFSQEFQSKVCSFQQKRPSVSTVWEPLQLYNFSVQGDFLFKAHLLLSFSSSVYRTGCGKQFMESGRLFCSLLLWKKKKKPYTIMLVLWVKFSGKQCTACSVLLPALSHWHSRGLGIWARWHWCETLAAGMDTTESDTLASWSAGERNLQVWAGRG